jgi:hypothetical protein
MDKFVSVRRVAEAIDLFDQPSNAGAARSALAHSLLDYIRDRFEPRKVDTGSELLADLYVEVIEAFRTHQLPREPTRLETWLRRASARLVKRGERFRRRSGQLAASLEASYPTPVTILRSSFSSLELPRGPLLRGGCKNNGGGTGPC